MINPGVVYRTLFLALLAMGLSPSTSHGQGFADFKIREVPLSALRMDLAKQVQADFLTAVGSGSSTKMTAKELAAQNKYLAAQKMTAEEFRFLGRFSEVLAEKMGLAGTTLKEQLAVSAKQWAIMQAPMPPLSESVFIPLMQKTIAGIEDRSRQQKEDRRRQQMTADASALIQRFIEPDQVAAFKDQFPGAPPPERSRIFVAAMKQQVKDRIFPTPFSESTTLAPWGGAQFVDGLDPGSAQGWETMTHEERTITLRRALLNYLDLAARVAAPEGTKVDMDESRNALTFLAGSYTFRFGEAIFW